MKIQFVKSVPPENQRNALRVRRHTTAVYNVKSYIGLHIRSIARVTRPKVDTSFFLNQLIFL